MATIYKEFHVAMPPEFVWEAIKDIGAVHSRLARGFVSDTVLDNDVRTVMFSNGVIKGAHRFCHGCATQTGLYCDGWPSLAPQRVLSGLY